MKYWRGKPGTSKDGKFGTMDDDGKVPDADECTKAEYDNWISTIVPDAKPDIDRLLEYAKSKAWI